MLHKLHDSTSVGSNPAQRQDDFHNNSNIMGGALVNNDCVMTTENIDHRRCQKDALLRRANIKQKILSLDKFERQKVTIEI